MYKATKFYVENGQLVAAPADAVDHHVLHVQREIMGHQVAIEYATAAPARDVKWKDAQAWAEQLDVGGITGWKLAEVTPAHLVVDFSRTEFPQVDPKLLPNHAGKWVWTATEDLTPPAGYAVAVGLDDGDVDRSHRDFRYGALACRPGQLIG